MTKGIKKKLLLSIAFLLLGNYTLALSDDYLEFVKQDMTNSYEPMIPEKTYHGLVNPNGKNTKNKEITPEIEQAFEPYVSDLSKYIKRHWSPPRLKASHSVVIRFSISKDGTIYNPIIFKTSGVELMDKSAINAANKAAKYRPLPKIYPRESVDIQMTFDYHAL